VKPFLIRHADGREYELESAEAYKEHYMHQGFAIVDPQPEGYERPDLSEKKATAKREKATGDEVTQTVTVVKGEGKGQTGTINSNKAGELTVTESFKPAKADD
jgi:hypothetical protein